MGTDEGLARVEAAEARLAAERTAHDFDLEVVGRLEDRLASRRRQVGELGAASLPEPGWARRSRTLRWISAGVLAVGIVIAVIVVAVIGSRGPKERCLRGDARSCVRLGLQHEQRRDLMRAWVAYRQACDDSAPAACDAVGRLAERRVP